MSSRQVKKKGGKSGSKMLPAGARQPRRAAEAANVWKAGSSVTIRHSEQIASLASSATAFTVLDTYDLLPTDTTTFPWLSSIARNYEKYKFNSVTFRMTTASPMTAGGMVTACFDYDYGDPIPESEQSMTMNETWKQNPIRESLELRLRPDRLTPARYCDYRAGDVRLAYAGFLTVAVSGISVGYSASLWVDYEVTLSSPTIPTDYLVTLPTNIVGSVPATGNETPFERLFRLALETAPKFAKFIKLGEDTKYRIVVPPKSEMTIDTCIPYGVSDSYLPTPTPPYMGCETIPTLTDTEDVEISEFPVPAASFGPSGDAYLHKFAIYRASTSSWLNQSLSDLWKATIRNFSDYVKEIIVEFPYRAALLPTTDFVVMASDALLNIAIANLNTKSACRRSFSHSVVLPALPDNGEKKTQNPAPTYNPAPLSRPDAHR